MQTDSLNSRQVVLDTSSTAFFRGQPLTIKDRDIPNLVALLKRLQNMSGVQFKDVVFTAQGLTPVGFSQLVNQLKTIANGAIPYKIKDNQAGGFGSMAHACATSRNCPLIIPDLPHYQSNDPKRSIWWVPEDIQQVTYNHPNVDEFVTSLSY